MKKINDYTIMKSSNKDVFIMLGDLNEDYNGKDSLVIRSLDSHLKGDKQIFYKL